MHVAVQRTTGAESAARFIVTGDGVALAENADRYVAASVLTAQGILAADAFEVLDRAEGAGTAQVGEVEPWEAPLPHPWDVQVASRWPAVNAFRFREELSRYAPVDPQVVEAAEMDAVRVARPAAERVVLSAEVTRVRRAHVAATGRRY